jgi:hypothetical protein
LMLRPLSEEPPSPHYCYGRHSHPQCLRSDRRRQRSS